MMINIKKIISLMTLFYCHGIRLSNPSHNQNGNSFPSSDYKILKYLMTKDVIRNFNWSDYFNCCVEHFKENMGIKLDHRKKVRIIWINLNVLFLRSLRLDNTWSINYMVIFLISQKIFSISIKRESVL